MLCLKPIISVEVSKKKKKSYSKRTSKKNRCFGTCIQAICFYPRQRRQRKDYMSSQKTMSWLGCRICNLSLTKIQMNKNCKMSKKE